MTGIILAGGKNSRMGVKKAFLNIGGTTIIDTILSIYRNIFKDIIIVTNTPEEYAYCQGKVIKDIIPNSGPLGGIYTGLLTAKDEYSFVTACDMPFINDSIVKYISGIRGYDIVVPVLNGQYEPLCALYSKRCLPAINKQLKDGKLSIKNIFKMCSVKELNVEEFWEAKETLISFTNVNTPEELKNALKIRESIAPIPETLALPSASEL